MTEKRQEVTVGAVIVADLWLGKHAVARTKVVAPHKFFDGKTAAFVLALAFGLFCRAIPILLDRIAVEPEAVRDVARAVCGMRRVKTARSRSTGGSTAIDMVVTVDSGITASEAHIDHGRIEEELLAHLSIEDGSVHVEPDG